ncbi:hypothetical protein P3T36_006967 [Kitasatospora sp. MAP12-15]|uniref:hypothetical protein n=1 Tax=unclassified Kitasatospora TaxID=2633591 RepID=UPI00247373C9|nr:hypothetical protein [Kitasatospora sp. MAP12-44]MDH6115381.1 hypothetical protein [Kitasatospora sp. MAP12-44]
MNEEISRRLHEAAQAHQPDHARMLARVQRGVAGPAVRHRARRGLRSVPRAALAGLVAGGILATGGLAVAAMVATSSSSDTVVAPASPSPSPSASTGTPGTPPSRPTPVLPAPVTTPSSPRPTPSAAVQAQNGPLWSAGSVDPHSTVYWSQENLVLKTTQPLTSLTVELRFAQTGGVQDTGDWRTLPTDDFTVTVQQTGGALVYRWVLKPGRTVPAGEHEFAGQFNHATGVRSAAGDAYRVDALGSGGSASSVWGGFAPAQ